MAIGINADYGMEDIAVRQEDGQTVVVKCDVLEMAGELANAYNTYHFMDQPKYQTQETELLNKVFVKYGLPPLNSGAADKLATEVIKKGTDLKNEHRAILEPLSAAESPDSSAA